jgi:hypothetical protein
VYPFAVTRPTASSLNYSGANQVLANEILVKQTIGGGADFSVYTFSGAHVVIDAVGYFMAPQATALSCVAGATSASTAVPDTASETGVIAPDCPAGYTATSMACLNSGPQVVLGGYSTATCWFSDKNPGDGQSGSGYAFNTCCRIPGR